VPLAQTTPLKWTRFSARIARVAKARRVGSAQGWFGTIALGMFGIIPIWILLGGDWNMAFMTFHGL